MNELEFYQNIFILCLDETNTTSDNLSKFNNNNKILKKSVTTIAKRRWKILAKALCHQVHSSEKSLSEDYLASVRRFTCFNLFQITPLILKANENWMIYRAVINELEYSLIVHEVNQKFTPEDLIGFNNTGNICIWPSEECLAYYILCNLKLFSNRRILELGGGMSCLAGLLIAKYAHAKYVHLSDGNKLSIQNAKEILSRNASNITASTVCSVLKWENIDVVNDNDQYDCVISADCLFFDGARKALINALWNCMKLNGFALIMAPCRGDTLNDFIQCAEQKGFKCIVKRCYNNVIWQKHLDLSDTKIYNENIHYPVLIEVTKLLSTK